MFFRRKRSKKTKDKLRRATTRRIISSLQPRPFISNRRFGDNVVENQRILHEMLTMSEYHQDLVRKALVHILEGELAK
jgi:hypothetical protein